MVKTYLKFYFISIVSSVTILSYNLAFAVTGSAATGSSGSSGIRTGIEINGKTGFSSFVDYILNIFAFAMKAGVVLTTIMIIFAGYRYMTSQGNPTAINEAKDIIIGSLTGFALLLLVFLILKIFNLPAF